MSPDAVVRRVAGSRLVIGRGELLAAGVHPWDVDALSASRVLRRLLPSTYLLDPELHPTDWDQLSFAVRGQAALTYAGPTSALILHSAAEAWNIDGRPRDDGVIEVVRPVGTELDQRDGLRIHTWKLGSQEIEVVGELRATNVVRTISDVILAADRWHAISMLDSALNRGRLSVDDLALVEAGLVRRKGAVEARRRLTECDGRAQSPLETRARLVCSDIGYAPHDLQWPVRGREGELLGFADLHWRRRSGRPLLGECDGVAFHGGDPERPQPLYGDRWRADSFVITGHDVVRMTWADVHRPAYIRSMMAQAFGDAA